MEREMTAKIMAELRTLSEHWQFDVSSDDNIRLYDHLECGVREGGFKGTKGAHLADTPRWDSTSILSC